MPPWTRTAAAAVAGRMKGERGKETPARPQLGSCPCTTPTMAQAGQAQAQMALIERAEVHKSCKALEVVVNLFNDYCQAANAAAQVEKKLAKALRDAASCKATSEPPCTSTHLPHTRR